MKATLTTYTEVTVSKEELIKEIKYRFGIKNKLIDQYEYFTIGNKVYGINDYGHHRGGIEKEEIKNLTQEQCSMIVCLDYLEKYL